MLPSYTPEEMQNIIDTLSSDLKEALFGAETTERIVSIAEKNGVNATVLAKIVGLVLVGLLHPNDLAQTLREELKTSENQSKRVDLEVRRFILSPVRESISGMYEFEFTPVAKPVEAPKEARRVTPTETPGQDVYREPVE